MTQPIEIQGVKVGEWKFREVDGETELFNMQYDAEELYNQAEDYPELVGKLRKRMKALGDDVGIAE